MAGGEELHVEGGLQEFYRRESCLSSPAMIVWSQKMVGARPGAECRVIRVRWWREYAWAAIGKCVRFDAGVRVAVVCSRDGVGMDGG